MHWLARLIFVWDFKLETPRGLVTTGYPRVTANATRWKESHVTCARKRVLTMLLVGLISGGNLALELVNGLVTRGSQLISVPLVPPLKIRISICQMQGYWVHPRCYQKDAYSQ